MLKLKAGDKIRTTSEIHGCGHRGPPIGTKGEIISVKTFDYGVLFESYMSGMGLIEGEEWFVYDHECVCINKPKPKLEPIKQREFTDDEWLNTVGE